MFRFKQFTVNQDRCAFKVGTDGVLLGAWANLEGAGRILDIGTGSGLLALMAAQRNPAAVIDAVEIDPAAARQAGENFAASPWSSRLTAYHTAIQEYHPAGDRYDVILCNPPFFIGSTPNPNTEKKRARHCDTLTHHDLLSASGRLLAAGGHLQLILPVREATDLTERATGSGWFLRRKTVVFPLPGKPAKRHLVDLSLESGDYREDFLIIEHEHHRYHEKHQELTRDFYLHA